ncbi:hypothetical protein Glove_197g72 [Diversispora epigaea]|uniref:Uncharacterized protein n=1 Tax=Diversispora epigaea TaxID=1348612 RepID=A0A397IQB1_9GLOM|nr:hypothetical protein Glove_197g72 [Diversispora epigaea]
MKYGIWHDISTKMFSNFLPFSTVLYYDSLDRNKQNFSNCAVKLYYLGQPSEDRWPDFLKTSEHPSGLQLDIPYYDYGFAIEVQGQQHEKYIEFFHRGDPNNFIKQQERINSRMNCAKKLDRFKVCLVLRRPIYSYSRASSRIGSH